MASAQRIQSVQQAFEHFEQHTVRVPKAENDSAKEAHPQGIRGADLVFACIGPALEIFSRYSRVETAEGREVTLAEYLEKIWEVVGRAALQQVLGASEAGGPWRRTRA